MSVYKVVSAFLSAFILNDKLMVNTSKYLSFSVSDECTFSEMGCDVLTIEGFLQTKVCLSPAVLEHERCRTAEKPCASLGVWSVLWWLCLCKPSGSFDQGRIFRIISFATWRDPA